MIILGIIIALLLAFSGFFRFSLDRRYVTRKLNRVLLAREFSNSIALLAAHQLRCRHIHDSMDSFTRNLSTSFADMPGHAEGRIEFVSELKSTIKELVAAGSELKNLSYRVRWLISKKDFQPGLAAYSCEKSGLVRLLIETTYSPPGFNSTITEEYLYTLDVVVSLNIVPILSKFSLYVKDAVAGEGKDRFNKVLTDKSGNLKSAQLRPWVLQNGDSGGKIGNRLIDIVRSPRGLVYLGGGAVILANARAWGEHGDFSEGFHLYKQGRAGSMYTVAWLGNTALINWEAGICDDVSEGDCKLWHDMVKDGFADELKHNSTFRLMGTDKKPSPTLVFGDVFTRTMCCRIFKASNRAFGLLPFAGDDAAFNHFKSGDDPKKDISFFISQVGNVSRKYYNVNYASRLWELPYNRAIGYLISEHRVPDPVTAKQLQSCSLLQDLVSGKAMNNKNAHKVPEPFDKIFSGVSQLSAQETILEKSEVPGKRTALTVTVEEAISLNQLLEKEGFLKNGKLDLNGWLYIENSAPMSINRQIQLMSHAGIVVKNSDVTVSAKVSSESDRFFLNLVVLDGDVIIRDNSAEKLNLALTSGRQVKIVSAGGQPAKIRGNMAMRQIRAGTLPELFASGLELEYEEKLSVLPFEKNEAEQQKVMMHFIGWEPRLVE